MAFHRDALHQMRKTVRQAARRVGGRVVLPRLEAKAISIRRTIRATRKLPSKVVLYFKMLPQMYLAAQGSQCILALANRRSNRHFKRSWP